MLLGSFSSTKLTAKTATNQELNYRWFSRYLIAATLVDENKRFLISSIFSSTSILYIAALLSVSLEIGCKPPTDDKNCVQYTKKVFVKDLFDLDFVFNIIEECYEMDRCSTW